MSAQHEVRVGMSLYWVTVVKSGPGYRATWKQHGLQREVWSAGHKGDALDEVRIIARGLDEELARVAT